MKSHTSIFFSEVLILIGLLFMEDNQNAIRLGQREKRRRATNSNQKLKHFKRYKIVQSSRREEKIEEEPCKVPTAFWTFIDILKLIRNCKEESKKIKITILSVINYSPQFHCYSKLDSIETGVKS